MGESLWGPLLPFSAWSVLGSSGCGFSGMQASGVALLVQDRPILSGAGQAHPFPKQQTTWHQQLQLMKAAELPCMGCSLPMGWKKTPNR